ncbi:putative MutS family protein [Listeria floridensis FSL S10-1187]|uniref:MutS family protein n=1 Tax=Listeria floridensis FSL S10-1187 TaxID=1265817 RepID=A0ABN0RD64_9LIST|nr:mannonate oxidoreductase [Listeria floridensis]EUJ28511.1 putative MutS family protein [Listeria floridensis FSL S10-1187]
MNTNTFEKLEYPSLIERLAENCVSDMAKERAEELLPYKNSRVIKQKLAETTEARKILDTGQNLPLFGASKIKQLITKLEKSFELTPQELTEIADFLRSTRRVGQFLTKNEGIAPSLAGYASSITTFLEIEEEIYAAIRNGEVDSAASSGLRKARKALLDNQAKITGKLDKFMKNSENKKYIQEFFVANKNERYTIPIKASFQKFVRGTIIETSSKGTTVFIEPESVTKLNDEQMALKGIEQAEIYQILSTLAGAVFAELAGIKHNIDVMTEFDFIFAKGKLSRQMEASEPKVNQTGIIELKQARHPLLDSKKTVPLDFILGESYRSLIITGPNAGGKTVVLKTVGLLTLMMMTGLHIPAESESKLSVFERVFVDIGDNQSIENALSTFSSHIQNTASILSQLNDRSLVLFDEIGSGTEPNEGAALAIAILEECYRKGAITAASTHYAEIKRYGATHPDFMNARMAFDSVTLEPKYKLIIGESGESNALYIARKMKLNPKVIRQAETYITTKDYHFEKINFHRKTEQIEEKPALELEKGDRVQLLETGEVGLVYTAKDHFAVIDVDGKKQEVQVKRLKLVMKAAELYPQGYDLDQLFTSFEERKEAHDFARGSKKALRRVQKEIKTSLKDQS